MSFATVAVDNASSLVGTWFCTPQSGIVMGFVFGENNDVSFHLHVWGDANDIYSGTYIIEADTLTATFERSEDGFGETLSAGYSVETDVLTLTNIHEEPYNSPFGDVSGEWGLIGMDTISFERSESPIPVF